MNAFSMVHIEGRCVSALSSSRRTHICVRLHARCYQEAHLSSCVCVCVRALRQPHDMSSSGQRCLGSRTLVNFWLRLSREFRVWWHKGHFAADAIVDFGSSGALPSFASGTVHLVPESAAIDK